MRLATLLLLLSAAGAPARAQVVWTPVETGLPPSVEVFETGAGGGLRAWYVLADLADPALRLSASLSNAPLTVARFAEFSDAFVAINGGFFAGSESRSLVVNGGYVYAPNERETLRGGVPFFPTRGAIGRLQNSRLDVAWVYGDGGTGAQTAYPQPSPNAPGAPQPRPTAAFPAGGAPWNAEDAMGGGPVLVQDGRRRITWTEEVFFGTDIDTTTASARTVAGRTADGRLLLLVAEAPGLTLPEAADLVVALGAAEALNLDGGDSSALWAGGGPLLPGERRVLSALVLRPAGDNDPLVLDTGSPAYRETGTWTESPDPRFYGTTPARLNRTGIGTDRATFDLRDQGLGGGCGYVEAWWTPAPTGATNVVFTLYNDFGSIVFPPADQTDPATADRWNRLGYNYFGQVDSLVVTDDATGTTSPAFVSVDAVRIFTGVCPATEAGPEATFDLALAPNPARDATTATFALDAAADVRVSVVDLLGRTVRDVRLRLAAGPQSVRVETAGLAGGLYVVRVEAAGGGGARRAVATQRLAVAR